MKSKLLVIVLLLMLLPLNVDAASITSATVSQVNEQEVGTSFYLPFYVNFSGVGNSVGETSGIYMVGLLLEFDDSVLEIDHFYSDFFDTEIYKSDGKYYVLSIADSDSTGNKCSDKFLSCSSQYMVNIRFHVKNDSKDSVDVKLVEASAGAFKVDDTLESYIIDNMEELEYTTEVISNIKIKKTEKENSEVYSESVITEGKAPEIKNEIIQEAKQKVNSNNNNSENIKSTNNNLKSLIIENYQLDFKSDQLEYDITVNDDVYFLDIKVETEDAKATYKIIGAESLEDEVKVVVKAESGEEKTYKININREIQEKKKTDNKKFDISKETQNKLIIGGSIILVILIIIFIVSHHGNRKLDKMLDKM